MSIVLVVVAAMGTFLVAVIKVSRNYIDIYAPGGVITNMFTWLYVFTASATVLLLFFVLRFIFFDINRYNVLYVDYKRYDFLSDENYNFLIELFSLCFSVISYFFVAILSVFLIKGSIEEKVAGIIVFIVLFSIAYWGVKTIIKRKLYKIAGIWIILSIILYLCLGHLVNSKSSKAEIVFQDSGEVIICNEGFNKENKLVIKMYDEKLVPVCEININEEELLYAKEHSVAYNFVGEDSVEEGLLISEQTIYWKYIFDIKKYVNDSGTYYIYITIKDDNGEVHFKNMFRYFESDYVFTKDKLNKEY